MKAKLLLILLLAGISYKAQILTENFEGITFPPTGWSATATAPSRTWQPTPLPVSVSPWFIISGSKSAGIDYLAQANTADLTTPSFSLDGVTNPVLHFKAVVGWVYMIRDNAGDLLVQISVNNGVNWSTIWNEDTQPGWFDDGDNNDATDTYQTVPVQINLSPYLGHSNVKIRFRYIATDADAVAIDDVQILSGALSTNEVSKVKTNIYPNPTKGELTIKGDKKVRSSAVYDFSGKVLLQNATSKIDVSSLAKGIYVIKIDFEDGTFLTDKVIKE
ncbi:T9SS type A sorting domain-containing protein [Chryseobacterium sp.]|uniref:T9SS type A sorting domain-containing protein n=1 Tax=Chryseobacterium sp. TaxID=1871047 RepID=UPI00388D00A7